VYAHFAFFGYVFDHCFIMSKCKCIAFLFQSARFFGELAGAYIFTWYDR
jgi:hypothetical protein